MNANSSLPTRKVGAAGLAGAVSILIVWILNAAAEVDVPPEAAAAITTVLSFIAGYLVPEAPESFPGD